MATTLPDATEHAAVEEKEGGVGIITRKKAEKGVAIVTRNNQYYYNTSRRVMVNFRPSFWRESRNN